MLDVSPIPAGATAGQALANTIDLARHAEALGYTRYWLAEHHGALGIASSAPEVLIGHVATATETIRVGSGGIMLPNHSPLKVAETFRVLHALHPGRIDLGLGRAPGTDPRTALALRRSRYALVADDFLAQLEELLGFLFDDLPPDHPFHGVQAAPAGVPAPALWMLGSSGYGGTVAAQLGFGFAFARHINPHLAVADLRAYREAFRPSPWRAAPEAILALSVICADSDERAEELAASPDLAWLRIAQGRPGPIPSVAEARAYPYSPAEDAQRRAGRARHVIGGPQRVHAEITRLVEESGADEVMVLTTAHDHDDRRRSYELLAERFGLRAGGGARGKWSASVP